MSKLAHTHQPTMDALDRKRAIENGDEDLLPRCTCLRRDLRYCDDPYSEPPILRRDPSCEVHGIDPDVARDRARDDRLTGGE